MYQPQGMQSPHFLILQPALKLNDYNHQQIFCKMLSHMTLTFDKRNFEETAKRSWRYSIIYIKVTSKDPKQREEEQKTPMKMCAAVLRIYEKFFLRAYIYLFSETWEYIIKLLLGLSTFVLEVIIFQ